MKTQVFLLRETKFVPGVDSSFYLALMQPPEQKALTIPSWGEITLISQLHPHYAWAHFYAAA